MNPTHPFQAMKTLAVATSVALGALAAALPATGLAQAGAQPGQAQAQSVPSPSMTEGEVRKVDLDAGKVTLRHAEIKHLDMPGMTMVFAVRDKGQLAQLKPGDKVTFMVVREGGKLLLTDIQATP